jgi:cytochrome c oxidase assembly protein subunit 15
MGTTIEITGAPARGRAWARALAVGVAAATLLMVFAGGAVTTLQAGDSEPTWSVRFWEWFRPWSELHGGHFYEMTHRQLGTVIGFLAVALAVVLWKGEPRTAVRVVGLAALALVIAQGVLGGLRVLVVFDPGVQSAAMKVTGAAEPLRLRAAAAMVHGALGHALFALMVAIATVTSPRWFRDLHTVPRDAVAGTRRLAAITVAVVFAQLILGTYLRHAGWMTFAVIVHAAGALLTALYAVLVAFQAGALGPAAGGIRRPALFLALGVQAQVFLGVYSYVVPRALFMRTVHQVAGSVLLALGVVLVLRARRHLRAIG